MYLLMAVLLGILFYFGNILLPFSGINIPVFYIEIVALALTLFFLIKTKRVVIDKFTVVIFCLIIIHTVTLFTTEDFVRAFEGVKTYIFLIVIYYSIKSFLETLNSKKIFKFIVAFEFCFFFFTFFKIIEIVISNNLYLTKTFYMYKSYFSLPFGNSNYIAQIMLFFTVAFFISALNNRRFFYFLLFTMGITSLFLLNSRSAILSLIITLLIYFTTSVKKLRFNIKTSVVFIIVVVSLFLVGRQSVFFTLALERFKFENGNISSRLNQYNDIINYIINSGIVKFLIGNGMGTETSILNSLLIHNIILKVIFSIGILGFLSYVIYYYFFLSDILSISKEDTEVKKYLYSIIALGISSLVEPVLYTSFIEYFLVMYLAFVSTLKRKKALVVS
ncbi:MAG TPA: O-antigen ligase family protein [Bacillus sp. (in: firmicutes)]|nr:O-antigen ligase family protein [Bacillus sp. (in: firmicutes)]